MQLAIQETLLGKDAPLAQCERAQAMGLAGVEFLAAGIDDRISEIAAALDTTGVKAAGLNVGGTHLLHPDFLKRDAAIASIRTAMGDSLDLESGLVIFGPQRADTPRLPDLRPYKHQAEMEADFLAAQCRATLADLAYAMGATLALAPAHRYDTPLLHRLEQTATVLEKNDHHPHLRVAAHTFCMALEEDDLYTALERYGGHLAVVHLADHNGRLPGQGWVDFGRVVGILQAVGFDGWLTLAGHAPAVNDPAHRTFRDDLRAAVDLVRGLLD